MAQQSINSEVIATMGDYDRLEQAKAVINDCLDKADGLAERIAGQLYVVARKELYKLEDFTSMGEWAAANFDISKGTCSDAINTYDRFGDKDHIGQIAFEYRDYKFSSLIAMKSMSDEEITLAKIDPTMSRAAIKKAMASYKALQDKEATRPKLEKAFAQAYNNFSRIVSDKDSCVAFIEKFDKDYFTDNHIPPITFYEEITPALDTFSAVIDNRNMIVETCVENDREVPPIYADRDKYISLALCADVDGKDKTLETLLDAQAETERVLKQIEDELTAQEQEQESPEQEQESPEQEQESSTVENGQESSTVEHDTVQRVPHSMPCVTLNLKDFINGNGQVTKKELLARVWEEVSKVQAHECELVITFME